MITASRNILDLFSFNFEIKCLAKLSWEKHHLIQVIIEVLGKGSMFFIHFSNLTFKLMVENGSICILPSSNLPKWLFFLRLTLDNQNPDNLFFP